jgi:DNA-3-methyladenine glycosylase II
MYTKHVILTPRGEFSLAQSIAFLSGFVPLSYGPDQNTSGQPLRLAFPTERDWRPVAVSAHETDGGRISAAVVGDADSQSARDQLERMLSLDIDASTLDKTLSGDDVAAGLVDEFRGLRPVCFASPYEAASWAVLSQRVQMKQAAKIRVRICERFGHAIEVDGETLHSFPDPETLRATRSIEGVPDVKVARLHGIAEAALEGRLDAATLRAAGAEQAIEDVQQIPGIGPFSADLVVIRGAGEPDHFSRTERRLHAAMADAYDVDAHDIDELEAIAARWKPFRSWIGFLFRTRLAMSSA